jgi:hypothetical protein
VLQRAIDEIGAVGQNVFKRQQRDVGEVLIVDFLPLRSQRLHGIADLYSVPIENSLGDQTQAARLIHDINVVTSSELTLVSEENTARQLLPIFSFMAILAQTAEKVQ